MDSSILHTLTSGKKHMQISPETRILVVEDDPHMCESLRYLLSFHGYDVRTSMDRFDAQQLLLATAFDLVLLDLRLGEQCGFSIMDHLVEKKLDTKVIIVTGQHSESKAITALRKGAIDYLKKPFEPDSLLDSVKRVLGLRKRQRELKRVYTSIVSSRERYRNVIDSQNYYLCRLNSDYNITFINKAYADYWGNAPRTMIGQPYKSLVQHSIRDALFNKLAAMRSDLKPFTVEYRIVDMQDRLRWQRWQFYGIRGDHGDLSEIECVGRDVTRRKMKTKALVKSRERFRNLVETTSDWIWELDTHGVYTYASPVIYDLLGYRPEEVVGKRPFDFMPKEEAQRIEPIFNKVMAYGRPLKSIERIARHKNGKRITLESSGVPVLDDMGTAVAYRGMDRNITVRKLMEKSLSKDSGGPDRTSRKNNSSRDMLVICASCKKIRDAEGVWNPLEAYFGSHFDIEFSHGICPQCANNLYPELYEEGDK
jgi:PAS domain S-box-containing protein